MEVYFPSAIIIDALSNFQVIFDLDELLAKEEEEQTSKESTKETIKA